MLFKTSSSSTLPKRNHLSQCGHLSVSSAMTLLQYLQVVYLPSFINYRRFRQWVRLKVRFGAFRTLCRFQLRMRGLSGLYLTGKCSVLQEQEEKKSKKAHRAFLATKESPNRSTVCRKKVLSVDFQGKEEKPYSFRDSCTAYLIAFYRLNGGSPSPGSANLRNALLLSACPSIPG